MHAVGTGSARRGRESDALAVFLLENGAKWTRGETLRRAVASDMPGTASFLLEHGEKAGNLLCDITSKNGYGVEIARSLLAHGAPVDERKGACTPLGHLCWEWAVGDEEARTRLLPVMAVLLDNGADPTLRAMSPRLRKKLASRMLRIAAEHRAALSALASGWPWERENSKVTDECEVSKAPR